jgi:hypothetical protein
MVAAVVAARASAAAFHLDMVDAMNAQHGKDYAGCTKGGDGRALQRGATVAAGVIRSLRADQQVRTGIVLADAPPRTAEELITGGLRAHLDEHFGSIRKTVGHD